MTVEIQAGLYVHLTTAAGRMAAAELELECKGHRPTDCQAAVKRATKLAAALTERLPESIQGVAFSALLDRELRAAEPWLEGVEEARRRGDYRRGMLRAMRDGRWREGVERVTGRPVGRAAQEWEAQLDAAVDGWAEP